MTRKGAVLSLFSMVFARALPQDGQSKAKFLPLSDYPLKFFVDLDEVNPEMLTVKFKGQTKVIRAEEIWKALQ